MCWAHFATIYGGMDSEYCSQSDNSIHNRTQVDLQKNRTDTAFKGNPLKLLTTLAHMYKYSYHASPI